MVRVITVENLQMLIQQHGLKKFMTELLEVIKEDFLNWQYFQKSPRHATHYNQGVIELMPICSDEYYAFKYVNGHPYNPKKNKLTVAALGLLSDAKTGYPLLMSEMTLLTAFRTAATSALASSYLARKESQTFAIIGTGSQAEFQVLSHLISHNIKTVRYFDIDAAAMKKFAANLQNLALNLKACSSVEMAIEGADIITTATADKKQSRILQDSWIVEGQHINGVGGDCPGKTELDPALLKRCKIVVEYLEQSKIEGELQNTDTVNIVAELWELIQNKKIGREFNSDITLFDSVGFAIEDYSALRYVYQLAQQYQIGEVLGFVPQLADPKDLFSLALVEPTRLFES